MSWNFTICHLQTDKTKQERVFADRFADSLLKSQLKKENQQECSERGKVDKDRYFFPKTFCLVMRKVRGLGL